MRAGFPGVMSAALRRPFNPTRIQGLQLWLDAADTNTITSASGLVSVWADKSGNGNNVTQGTGANQPTTGSVTQNNLNTIDFDGGDWLVVPSAIFANIPNGPNTLFVVCKQDVAGVAERVITFNESGSTRYDLQYGASAGQIVFQSRNGFGSFVTQTGITATDYNVFKGRRSGTTQAIAFNGSAETTNALGADEPGCTGGDIGAFNNGASGHLNGTIAEIVLYNQSLSTAESGNVESYLMNKWGV